ncbi:MAG: hypothetical protein L0I24_15750 [Pseudonocardia sp.]|nr:hypothetical protein [Pseudonocardia sp.]
MERVVVLGRGGAGKSTFALHLSQVTELPVIELDQYFWSEDLSPLSTEAWTVVQERLATGDRWIMDGDLGPYDAPAIRLHRADTVVVLDLSLARCAWRAVRRSRERADFWWWLLTWRWRSRSRVLDAVATHSPQAHLRVLRTPAQVRRFLVTASTATS